MYVVVQFFGRTRSGFGALLADLPASRRAWSFRKCCQSSSSCVANVRFSVYGPSWGRQADVKIKGHEQMMLMALHTCFGS
jgi:hypothetical protein